MVNDDYWKGRSEIERRNGEVESEERERDTHELKQEMWYGIDGGKRESDFVPNVYWIWWE